MSGNNIYSTNKTTYKYNNRYYYSRLDEYSKPIYSAIENNLENMKTGNYKITIDYDYKPLLHNNPNEEVLKPYYDDAINALILDIPNIFYIDFSKIYLFTEMKTNILGTAYRVYLNVYNTPTYYAEGFSSKEDINQKIEEIEKVKEEIRAKALGGNYYTITEVHDWLVDNMEYKTETVHKSNIYGALVEKKGVCESYARAFKYLLDVEGIENILAIGQGTNTRGETEDHMWNYVKLNDKWYAVDVTWDDPIIIGGGKPSNTTKRKYFLLGSEEFFKKHVEKTTISENGKTFDMPILSIENYK